MVQKTERSNRQGLEFVMEFQVLGPVELRISGRALNAGHARQRAVLAVLLLDLGHVVPTERLIDRVWGETPPAAVRNALYGYIARLRAVITGADDGEATLSRRQGGYLLQADPEQVDLHRFRRIARQAMTAADDEAAEQLLRQALSLWHGPALTGVDSPWLNAMHDTLELERQAALLDLNDIRLRRGQHTAVAAELVSQSTAAPGDERLIGQLMLALYRCGRQADALRQYGQTRRYLADELGTDPAPQLQQLHQQILRADPVLAAPAPATRGNADAPVPRELPGDVAAFTGRATELAALDELLLGAPATTAAVISTVSGTAGVGKTALAVHWAHHAASHFPGGQLYVNLRGYDPDQPVSSAAGLAGLLRSLGVRGHDIPPDETERATRYRSLLAGKRMLIVLDNAATTEQVRPLLPGNPDCRVIVTSRDSLAGLVARHGARRIDLDLLPRTDAVGLLRELIGTRVDSEPDAAGTLAEQCARLPLALRVAAELAAARPATRIGELVWELGDEQRRLDLLDAGGEKRTAVRAIFSWSYDQLDHDAARAFRLAALHPGAHFDVYAVAALTASTHEQARRSLETLIRAHLLQNVGRDRYAVHDLLRAYARQLAAERDGEQNARAALTRLFDLYLSTAAAAMDTRYPAERHRRPRVAAGQAPAPVVARPDEAMAWLDSERLNMIAMTAHAAHHGWPAHVTQLSGTIRRYLDHGGHVSDAVFIHTLACLAARQTGDLAAEAEALMALGVVDWRQGNYERAADCHEQARALFGQAGNPVGQARALHNRGLVEQERSAYPLATDCQRQSLALFRDAGDSTGQAGALNSLGVIAEDLGQYQEAARYYREALARYRETGYKTAEATALTNLGNMVSRLGEYEQAAELHQQALALFRQAGHRWGAGTALRNLGVVDYQLGNHGQAAARQREALQVFREIGEPAGEAECRYELGLVLLAAGHPGDARRELTIALRLASQIGRKILQGHAHDGLGRTHHASGELDLSREHWNLALALFTELALPAADEVRAQLAALGDEP
jgi:DNA-binding SARP family transcriptional activator/tetratricopeptide (TPR) repeat protein